MNQRDKRVIISNLVVMFLLGSVLLVLFNLTITVEEEGFQCLNDPLGYGASKLSEANDAEFSCICNLAKENSPTIYFDSTYKNVEYPKHQQTSLDEIYDFNVSDIIVVQE